MRAACLRSRRGGRAAASRAAMLRVRRAELLDPVGAQHEPSPQEDEGEAERGEDQGEGEADDEEARRPPACARLRRIPSNPRRQKPTTMAPTSRYVPERGTRCVWVTPWTFSVTLLGGVIDGQVDDDDGPDDGGDAQPAL